MRGLTPQNDIFGPKLGLKWTYEFADLRDNV